MPPAGSTHNLTRGLGPSEQLERPSGFPSSGKTRHDSPVPTLQGPCSRSRRGLTPRGCQSGGAPALRPGAIAQSPGREAALAWASLAQRSPASSVLAREGAGCGSVDRQALLSMGFPRQEYRSGLPFPSAGDLPNPGIEPGSPAAPSDYCYILLLG